MWFDESVMYQIYPLGFCGAPKENDGVLSHKILKIVDYIPHLKKLNINLVYFCPIFESDTHGYDTKDYSKIDCRLGSNDDFKLVCDKLHENGIKVILDGVFNHVGRNFFAFCDVVKNRHNSIYKDWFNINFDGNSPYNDGLWYEGWEGHYELVKLNLNNPDVKNYLLNCISGWMDTFKIDGLRLDVAYMLNRDFMKQLRAFCLNKNPDFFLLGEMIHGDYNQIVNNEMLHSATNYECFKGIHSSLNSMNMFEIGYSLNRQFGAEHWTLYKGMNLVSFIDNHDVTRIRSNLENEKHIPLAFGLLMTMPGIPCLYYGSEWGIKGIKEQGNDFSLRPEIEKPEWTSLTDFVSKLAEIKIKNKTLAYGNLTVLHTTNHQLVFERTLDGERLIIAVNADENAYTAHFNANCESGTELITNQTVNLSSGLEIAGCQIMIIKCK